MISNRSVWVFDLDNTLYPSSCNLFAQIDLRMSRFISETLNISVEESRYIQKEYYHRYGTTLRGLMLEHGMAPEPFLNYVHDIDTSVLTPCPRLKDALSSLEGAKYIYTNGSVAHAERVLDGLGLSGAFKDIFDIAAADYVPKPSIDGYHKLLARQGIAANEAVMVEDIAKNLEPARALGMTTVWVPTHDQRSRPEEVLTAAPEYVDFVVEDLAGWLQSVAPRRAVSA